MPKSVAMGTIASRIAYLIRKKKLTSREFSEICQIPVSSLFAYTSGKSEPKASTVMRISKAFLIDPAWLMGEGELEDMYDVTSSLHMNAPVEKELHHYLRELDDDSQMLILRITKALALQKEER